VWILETHKTHIDVVACQSKDGCILDNHLLTINAAFAIAYASACLHVSFTLLACLLARCMHAACVPVSVLVKHKHIGM